MRLTTTFTMGGLPIPYLPFTGLPDTVSGPVTLSCVSTGNPTDTIRAYLPVSADVAYLEARVPAGTWATISSGSGLAVVGSAGEAFAFELRAVFPARIDSANYQSMRARLRLTSRVASGA
jgi:hypothetical protein